MYVEPDLLYKLLNGEIEEGGDIDKISFYCRLLTTYDWYTLLKLVPDKKYKEILSDSVIGRLYPKKLRSRFLYAREVLSR